MTSRNSVSVFVYVLVILFGSSTWLSVTGVWVELPLMVSVYPLPEGWSLPSYLTVVIQLAIIGPIIHWLCKKCAPRRRFSDPTTQIYGCLGFSTLATLFLALFWDRTAFVFGQQRSVGLFVLLFCVSLVSCTTSVLFLPNMFKFRPKYITAYFIGMGFSALIPSVVAIVQGSGRTICHAVVNMTNSSNSTSEIVEKSVDPNFSVSVFFGLMFLYMFACTVAFGLLNVKSIVAKELNAVESDEPACIKKRSSSSDADNCSNADDQPGTKISHHSASLGDEGVKVLMTSALGPNDPLAPKKSSTWWKRRQTQVTLLAVTFWCCALMNGVLPPIQSYASLPYGPTIFYFTAILSNIANPVGCFTLFFCTLKNTRIVLILTALVSAVSIYILVLAASSPHAILGSSGFGTFLCIGAWVVNVAILAYLRAVCGSLLRDSGDERLLWWCGVFTQAGSFIGSVVMFQLVNIFQVFHSAKTCP